MEGRSYDKTIYHEYRQGWHRNAIYWTVFWRNNCKRTYVVTTLVFGSHHLHNISCKPTRRVRVDSYLCLQSKSRFFPFLKSSLPFSLTTIIDALVGRNHKGGTKPPQCSARLLACLEACDSARLLEMGTTVRRNREQVFRRVLLHRRGEAKATQWPASSSYIRVSIFRYANARCICVLYRIPANEDSFPLRKRPLPQKANNPTRSRIRIEPFKERHNIERKNAL